MADLDVEVLRELRVDLLSLMQNGFWQVCKQLLKFPGAYFLSSAILGQLFPEQKDGYGR